MEFFRTLILIGMYIWLGVGICIALYEILMKIYKFFVDE